MFAVLSLMAVLIACGAAWRVLRPNGLDADSSRVVLTTLVYYLLLPALVLEVIWRTPLNLDSIRIAIVAAASIAIAAPIAWVIFRFGLKSSRPIIGALVIASVFPNVTYMGLPVLEATFGYWARGVAIQYDLFACTPLLLSAGIIFASHYGNGAAQANPLHTLIRVPALWAVLLAVILNLQQVPMPEWLGMWLTTLGKGVVPLMLIALGMSLQWRSLSPRSLGLLIPVIAIQLFLMPYVAWYLGAGLGLQGEWLTATVLEAAMPSMVLGIVLCDRYHLDSGLYASAVTVTTLVSLITLPFWYLSLT
jgi:malate permease and related proteins